MEATPMLERCISTHPDGVRLKLHIHPGAKRNGISGFFGDSVKFELQAPPVDGKANSALLKLFSKLTGCPRSAITIVAGELSRDKILRFSGMTREELVNILNGQIL